MLLVAGCTSASEPLASEPPTPTAFIPNEIETAEPTPTIASEPDTPTVSDDELIAVAISQLERDVQAGEHKEGIIAFDVLDQSVDAEGIVTLKICSWTGDTVFDEVRTALFRTSVSVNGAASATNFTTPRTSGECLNSTLIDTAFEFIDEYEAVRAEWSRNPSSFATDERAESLLHPDAQLLVGELLQRFVDDGVYFEPGHVVGNAQEGAVHLLYRRVRSEGSETLDFALCRPMNPKRGEYRDGVLIDDGKPADGSAGPHVATAYELVVSPDPDQSWLVLGASSRVWADCDRDDLPQVIQSWVGRDVAFLPLPS